MDFRKAIKCCAGSVSSSNGLPAGSSSDNSYQPSDDLEDATSGRSTSMQTTKTRWKRKRKPAHASRAQLKRPHLQPGAVAQQHEPERWCQLNQLQEQQQLTQQQLQRQQGSPHTQHQQAAGAGIASSPVEGTEQQQTRDGPARVESMQEKMVVGVNFSLRDKRPVTAPGIIMQQLLGASSSCRVKLLTYVDDELVGCQDDVELQVRGQRKSYLPIPVPDLGGISDYDGHKVTTFKTYTDGQVQQLHMHITSPAQAAHLKAVADNQQQQTGLLAYVCKDSRGGQLVTTPRGGNISIPVHFWQKAFPGAGEMDLTVQLKVFKDETLVAGPEAVTVSNKLSAGSNRRSVWVHLPRHIKARVEGCKKQQIKAGNPGSAIGRSSNSPPEHNVLEVYFRSAARQHQARVLVHTTPTTGNTNRQPRHRQAQGQPEQQQQQQQLAVQNMPSGAVLLAEPSGTASAGRKAAAAARTAAAAEIAAATNTTAAGASSTPAAAAVTAAAMADRALADRALAVIGSGTAADPICVSDMEVEPHKPVSKADTAAAAALIARLVQTKRQQQSQQQSVPFSQYAQLCP